MPADTQMMYDAMFSSQPYFQGNHAYCNCSSCGGRCDGPNSAMGWMTDKNGELMWVKRAKENAQKAQQQCGHKAAMYSM
jgi:hypothetical protein